MLVEIFTISILFLITLLYFLVIKPVRTMRRLTKDFQRQGYKVYTFPYRPFDQPAYRTLLTDSETGNPYKTFSTKFVEYDIIVSYNMKTPVLALDKQSTHSDFPLNNNFLKFLSDKLAILRVGNDFSIIAIDGRFDSRTPSIRIFKIQMNGIYFKKSID